MSQFANEDTLNVHVALNTDTIDPLLTSNVTINGMVFTPGGGMITTGDVNLIDSNTNISDSTDNTIQLKFDASGSTSTSTTIRSAQTSDITVTLPNSSDTLIGNSTIDTLTNKTIVDSSSNLAARTLVAADGDVLIDISAATEPTVGQILKATSNTTATWQDDTGGTAEANTGSNQGAGGVGVFKQKTGVDLEFKNINAGNNTISIVDDTGNDEIDISVNVGNISRNELSGTLSVANGGTGAATLGSGNVLVGAGTSAVTTTKAAPTGDFVGTSDTQTLTSKTIVDTSSNVAARTLVAADGAVLIDISGASEPTTGQILKATSNTTATWQADDSGETNTGSNQGTGGVGVFIQKTGVDLEFKNVNAGNNTISVVDDTGNNEIDISVNVGNINRNELSSTLSVANGGTGAVTLGSGNVLVGAGTSAVTAAKAAPTGDFVGTSDTQTLSSKTIVDSSSNLAARTLVAADGNVLIDISGSSEPTTGQVLVATSNTTATWQTDSSQNNTASNQGSGGVGVFIQKTGVDLEFKNVNAGNNTISVVDDTTNNEIDISVNVGNISRNELTGTLSVANGGTGTASLTSGSVLVGDGTNAVTTTKAAPTGDFVGTSDTQTLTSKTIVDSSSNVATRTLVAADGAVLIDVSGASEPTTGQILRATSNTTATWQADTTGSNQGISGVGVFVQKNGTDLEFKNINSGNNTISVVDDTGNNEIDIAVNTGNIDRNDLSGTLTVSSGGTGATTLTSGNVLIGAGTSAVTTTKSAPSGDFVGTSDTQILTSKTIVDSSSNLAARTLVSSDGAVLIDISGASEPTTGQILKATSNTTATWQNETGGAGESNTGSNQGTGGVGVFIQKTGVDLEFKNINATNNTISVTNDTGNNEIDIAVNSGNIGINDLNGTLSVANGGTGATTLTSGNVLIGAGASAVTTTKAAPTGDFVGTSDTQTLTSKTIIDTSSNIAARTLVAADGAVLIDISGSSEPTTGQILKATSNTTATWQADTTASNQGSGGVGVFKQKTGNDFEFKNINGGNGLVVTDDTTNNEIDITLPSNTKGDVIVHNGTTNIRLPVGSDDLVLKANNSATPGVEWGVIVFGSEYQTNEDSTEDSTTSSTYVNKVTITTTSLPAGDYRIGWYYNWRRSNTNKDFETRVRIDNTTDIGNHRQEAKDAGSDQIYVSSGHKRVTFTAGIHTIDIDYRSANGGTSFISNARLELWRVT